MANKAKGEVALKTKDQVYTLRYTVNALCDLEDQLGAGINDILKEFQTEDTLRIRTIRTVLWAGLKDKHPDITIAQAGDIITDAGTVAAVSALAEALISAFPDAKPVKGDEDPQD